MKRTVEFYVLWSDRTWSVVAVILTGQEAEMGQEDCVALARARLEGEVATDPRFEAIGPLYLVSQGEGEDA